MEPRSTPKLPTRGIIVVDSTELLPMTMRYPDATRRSPLDDLLSKTGTYLDILPILAQHGFRIIVPEMVALESAGIFHDKVDTRNPFKDRGREDWSEHRRPAKQFLVGQSDHILIAPAPPADETGGYRDFVAQLAQSYRTVADGNTSTHKSRKESTLIAKRLSVTRAYATRPDNMGEQHGMDIIADEIARQRKEHTSVPIFFFSSDMGARDELRKRLASSYRDGDPPVNFLTIDGMLCGLANAKASEGSNALQELGIAPDSNTHWKEMRNSPGLSKKPQTAGDSKTGFHDLPNDKVKTGALPFQEAVSGLSQELADARIAKQSEQQDFPKVDRVAEFRRKYGQHAKPAGGNGSGPGVNR